MPVVGQYIATLMRGGQTIGQTTLTRFFAIHVVILPLAIGFFLLGHFFMIRKQGISGPL
jgi:quinol-cytochrome oxidoreductase complex cytochrome b subunit